MGLFKEKLEEAKGLVESGRLDEAENILEIHQNFFLRDERNYAYCLHGLRDSLNGYIENVNAAKENVARAKKYDNNSKRFGNLATERIDCSLSNLEQIKYFLNKLLKDHIKLE